MASYDEIGIHYGDPSTYVSVTPGLQPVELEDLRRHDVIEGVTFSAGIDEPTNFFSVERARAPGTAVQIAEILRAYRPEIELTEEAQRIVDQAAGSQ